MKTLQQSYTAAGFRTEKRESAVHKFFAWCQSQEEHRLGWLAVIIAGHACFFTPFTALFIILGGNSMLLWAFAIAAITMSLVTNLAALPTKITIPVFFLSILIDVAVIINCISAGLSFNAA